MATKLINFMQYIIIFNFHSNIFHNFDPTLHNTEKYLQRYKKYLEIFCVLLDLAILHVFNQKNKYKSKIVYSTISTSYAATSVLSDNPLVDC